MEMRYFSLLFCVDIVGSGKHQRRTQQRCSQSQLAQFLEVYNEQMFLRKQCMGSLYEEERSVYEIL